MSCDEFAFAKTEDAVWSYSFPPDMDLTGYGCTARIAASEGAMALLSLSGSVTPNGSKATVASQSVVVTITSSDLQALPDGSPVSDPWVGVFEVILISNDGVKTRLDHGSFVLSKGIN